MCMLCHSMPCHSMLCHSMPCLWAEGSHSQPPAPSGLGGAHAQQTPLCPLSVPSLPCWLCWSSRASQRPEDQCQGCPGATHPHVSCQRELLVLFLLCSGSSIKSSSKALVLIGLIHSLITMSI